MTARPRIIVTLGRDLPDRPENLRLPANLVTTLLAEGAVPIIVPPGLDDRAVAELADEADGLLLPGGVGSADPHPRHFGEDVHPLAIIDEALDALEFRMIAAVTRRQRPILGICRGSQVLNVALGGSLVQHLPDHPINHKPDRPLDQWVHDARLIAGTRLHGIAGTAHLRVNSLHHQAIGRVGDGLRVAALAEDDVVEAVESTDPRSWIIGVQYHPEELLPRHPAHRALFASFIAACRDRPKNHIPARQCPAV